MTTESGSESKQPQENREAEKSKAAEEQTSPQNQPEKFPAAAGHSTPAKREQVSAQSFPRRFWHNGLQITPFPIFL